MLLRWEHCKSGQTDAACYILLSWMEIQVSIEVCSSICWTQALRCYCAANEEDFVFVDVRHWFTIQDRVKKRKKNWEESKACFPNLTCVVKAHLWNLAQSSTLTQQREDLRAALKTRTPSGSSLQGTPESTQGSHVCGAARQLFTTIGTRAGYQLTTPKYPQPAIPQSN